MSHAPKTEIGRLMKTYREHEHEEDWISEGGDGEEAIPTEKMEIVLSMWRLRVKDNPSHFVTWRGKPRNTATRHGRSWKKHIPLEDGEVATDSHGRLLYVLSGGRKVTQGVVIVKVAT